MLASGSSVARVTLTPELIDTINADTVVYTRVRAAVVNVAFASLAFPARMAYALTIEEAINARAMHTRVNIAQFHFLVASLSCEASRAVTNKIVDQVCAVGSQKAWILCAVINVDLAGGATPSERALALVTSLLQGHTETSVGTRTVTDCTGIDSDVACGALIARATKAVYGPLAWQVLAHCTFWACVVQAVTLLLLTLQATVTLRTLASVSLWLVDTRAPIVTRHAVTLIHVSLTELSCEACWTVADSVVVLSDTQATILTDAWVAVHR